MKRRLFTALRPAEYRALEAEIRTVDAAARKAELKSLLAGLTTLSTDSDTAP